MQRHSGDESKSGALGIMKGIESVKADGDRVTFTLKDGNADLPYLLADYHLIVTNWSPTSQVFAMFGSATKTTGMRRIEDL